MLQVKTYLDKSLIHGLGVFADQDIPKGTLVWRFNPLVDKIVTAEKLPEIEEKFVQMYAYYDTQLNKFILPVDNDRFTNHSDNPNTSPLPNGKMVAIKDIKAGEEITSNYYEIDFDVNTKLVNIRDN